jgi:MFS superfamily sulfate permease-like transporter
MHVRHSYRVRTRLLAPDADNVWRSSPVSERRLAAPGVAVYEFEAELFFANAGFFMEEVLSIASYPEVRWVVLDASGIDTIDYTAAKTLVQLREELDRRGIGLFAAAIKGKVAKVLARYRHEGELDQLSVYPSVKEALEAAVAELAKQRSKSSP